MFGLVVAQQRELSWIEVLAHLDFEWEASLLVDFQ